MKEESMFTGENHESQNTKKFRMNLSWEEKNVEQELLRRIGYRFIYSVGDVSWGIPMRLPGVLDSKSMEEIFCLYSNTTVIRKQFSTVLFTDCLTTVATMRGKSVFINELILTLCKKMNISHIACSHKMNLIMKENHILIHNP